MLNRPEFKVKIPLSISFPLAAFSIIILGLLAIVFTNGEERVNVISFVTGSNVAHAETPTADSSNDGFDSISSDSSSSSDGGDSGSDGTGGDDGGDSDGGGDCDGSA